MPHYFLYVCTLFTCMH